MPSGLSSALLDLTTIRNRPIDCLYYQGPDLIMMLKLVHPNMGYQFKVNPKVKYDVYSKFLPPYMPPTLYSEMGMFETFAKEIKRNIWDGTEAYLVGRRDESLWEKSRYGGATAAQSYVLRDDSSKGEMFSGMKALRNEKERKDVKKDS